MIRNFTPHPINLGDREIPSEGIIRCKEIVEHVDTFDGVEIIHKTFGELEGLPQFKEGTLIVASTIAATAAMQIGRIDVVVPGEVIRDEQGKIIGCKNLTIL